MSALRDDPLLKNTTDVKGFKVLPPCVLYARLGQGGMGSVYRGHHLNLDIDVAVKCLKPTLVDDDPTFVERFKREGRSAARINHQNVIRVFDVAEDNGLHYLIMEYVQGETARQRVERKGPLAVGEALQLIYESALGLGEAHRLGFVHRDVKPDNLLVSSYGQVKVADLGLAKPTLGGETSALSMAGQVMGTPPYMPPEQWNGERITGAADVWALGATLYFLLTGTEAIRGETVANIMSQIVLRPFPDVRKARDGVGDSIAELIERATAKAPGDRFLDGRELADAIAALPEHRITLRDNAAGTTEVRTMLSPPPMRQIEEVKALLRIGGTPPSGVPVPDAPDAEGRTIVSRERTRPKREASGRPRSRAPLAVLLLALAGGGAYAGWRYWPTQEPQDPDPGKQVSVDPFAEVERLTREGDHVGALLAARAVFAADASLPDREQRLAALAAAARGKLATELERERTEPVEPGGTATLRGRLRDTRAALWLGGEVAERGVDGTFVVQRVPDADGQVSVQVVLGADDDRLDLEPWSVELLPAVEPTPKPNVEGPGSDDPKPDDPEVAPPPVPMFAAELRAEGAEDDNVVRKADVVLTGRTNVPEVPLLFDGKPLADVQWQEDGSFEVQVPLANEGRNRLELRVGAADGQAKALEVVRLTTGPALRLVEPQREATATEAVTARIVVEADEWTDEVFCERLPDGARSVFEPVAGTNRWSAPEPLKLGSGPNEIRVTAKNRVTSSTTTLKLTCSVEPAVISTVTFDGTPLRSDDSPVYVKEPPTLQIETTGTDTQLRCNDEPCRGQVRIELAEGQRREVVLRIENALGQGNSWRRTFVRDGIAPVLDVEPLDPVESGARFELRGTCRDTGGVASVQVTRGERKLFAVLEKAGPDGSRRWSVQVQAEEAETLTVAARDLAGNESTRPVQVRIAAAAEPEAPAAPAPLARAIDTRLFEPLGERDANGFPAKLRHLPSGLELVRITPKLYAATGMVTQEQWGGSGSGPQLGISANTIMSELAEKLPGGLAVPTAAEWQLLEAEANRPGTELRDVKREAQSKREWLAPPPDAGFVTNWPITKEPSRSQMRTNQTDPNCGFRVVLRLN